MASDRLAVGSAVVAALALPLALRALVHERLEDTIVPALGARLGAAVSVAGAEADLDGTLRLAGVRLGRELSADAVEARRAGGAGARDVVRVTLVRPRVRARLVDGALEAGPLHPGARFELGGAGATTPRLELAARDGELALALPGGGRLRARGVAVVPLGDRLRLVARSVTARLPAGPGEVVAAFPRAAADVALDGLGLRRLALAGGVIALRPPVAKPLVVREVVVQHGVEAPGVTRVDGQVQGGGRVTARAHDGAVVLAAERLPLAPLASLGAGWLAPGGEVAGRAVMAREGDALRVTADFDVTGAVVRHPLVARGPVPVEGRVALDGRLLRGSRAAAGRVTVTRDGVVVEAEIDARWTVSALQGLRVTAAIPTQSCSTLLAAVPRPLVAGLEGLELDGTLAGHVTAAYDAGEPPAGTVDAALDVSCRVRRDPGRAPVAALAGALVHRLPDGTARTLAVGDPGFVPLAELPRHVPAAFVAAEDARFHAHAGFDVAQLARSLAHDLATGRPERGGSTISQQLAKNLWLTGERTLARKLVEAILTWRLEQRIAKPRILEAYLNVIELGAGVWGVGPAAARWFGVAPSALTPAQAAFLAAITPAPRVAERRLAAGRLDDDLFRRAAAILAALRAGGALAGPAHRRAITELATLRPRPAPARARAAARRPAP